MYPEGIPPFVVDLVKTHGQKKWLVTGVAGFIGSHLLHALLELGQKVIGIDNFATGKRSNLDSVRNELSHPSLWESFQFHEIDILKAANSPEIFKDVDVILHQAALGSVPRSIENPVTSVLTNVSGMVTILDCARRNGVSRVIYASSSSVYGDSRNLPQTEPLIGHVLSPYAATKRCDEVMAEAFTNVYPMQCVGLRYFNVFGPRQDPDGPYAAVIPLWLKGFQSQCSCFINGNGQTTRDFCYVKNVVQANILSALSPLESRHEVFNVSVGDETSLNDLFEMLREDYSAFSGKNLPLPPQYREFRPGDIARSMASTEKISAALGYSPQFRIREGIRETVAYFCKNMNLGAIT